MLGCRYNQGKLCFCSIHLLCLIIRNERVSFWGDCRMLKFNKMDVSRFWNSLTKRKKENFNIFVQQASYLQQASYALCRMMDTMNNVVWKSCEKEVKVCEVQGDALLTEFQEQLYERFIGPMKRTDMQTIAMSIDEFLDSINDAAKSMLLYLPGRIDPPLKELALYIRSQAESIKFLMSYCYDIKHNYAQMINLCDRITELEHAADDSYEEYIGSIFTNEKNAIELMKYKNIAEALEASTDAAKRISDNVRKIILRYVD